MKNTKRLALVIRTVVSVSSLRLTDRQFKQKLREVRFDTKRHHPFLLKFASSISPFARKKVENEVKIMKKNYDFVLK